MSKKNSKSPKIEYLSNDNYIRQKSRNLPLDKCFISSNWKESDLATIIITRKHITGNVTACLYLVDLACLGVKDSLYRFNVPFEDIEEIMEHSVKFTNISYELAHNIIYTAIEFAEEYGFNPCKEFTSITEHFLEEDNDDIPIIDVSCGGEDGKPHYVNTGFHTPAQEKAIIAQLEKTAGEGNYYFTLNGESSNFFDDDDDDFDDEDFDIVDFDDDDEDFDDDDFDDEDFDDDDLDDDDFDDEDFDDEDFDDDFDDEKEV